ncbi:hypothetical protein [Celeribacter sp.]|uniref:hypothetical protein n=1 Tax=Celeribacter sp. TaxID=1890673 RepID=UPI003A8D61EB
MKTKLIALLTLTAAAYLPTAAQAQLESPCPPGETLIVGFGQYFCQDPKHFKTEAIAFDIIMLGDKPKPVKVDDEIMEHIKKAVRK